MKLDYRADIDGLRALSILLVVIFHAFPNRFTGGFVGVDIFFVISGYLITRIIIHEHESRTFRLFKFYKRRILRIFPALIFVLTFTVILGWLLLKDYEYESLGKHIVGSAYFYVNFSYIFESGYFDISAYQKPLLHIWSLAVEEQFYLVWPIILILLLSKFTKYAAIILVTLVSLSLVYNLLVTNVDPDYSFFSPFTRFWQLGIGGLLAYWTITENYSDPERSVSADVLVFLGLLLIMMSAILLTKENIYPGYKALFPTIGALLVIYSGNRSNISRSILSNNFFVYIGKISYPLYLWHWPLISFYYIFSSDFKNPAIISKLLIISIILSVCTYHLLEKKLNNQKRTSIKTFLLVLIMIFIGICGLIININNGYQDRSVNAHPFTADTSLLNYYEKYRLNKNYYDDLKKVRQDAIRSPYCHLNKRDQTYDEYITNIHNCLIISSSKKNILIIGDSVAADFYMALNQTYREDLNFLQLTGAGCTPGVLSITDKCVRLLSFSKSFISQEIDAVIVAGSWHKFETFDSELLKKFLSKLNVSQNVYLVGPPASFTLSVRDILHKERMIISQYDVSEKYFDHQAQNLNLYLRSMVLDLNVNFIDRIHLYCGEHLQCPIMSEYGDVLIYDYGHISADGASVLANSLINIKFVK